ncbi:MAG: type 1 glutamine amidotransferase [Spirochaetota bacterium]
MRILWLQHVSFEGPAYIRQWAESHGYPMHGVMMYLHEPLPPVESFDFLIVMGGPMGVYDTDEYPWLIKEKEFLLNAIAAKKTVMGICLGAQLLADVLGAAVRKNPFREIGWYPVTKTSAANCTALGSSLPESFYSFHWHSDTFDIPPSAVHLASSEACRNQGFIWQDRVIGVQFHNEVTYDSLEALCGACSGELDGSRFVQEKFRIQDRGSVYSAHRLMDLILEYCAAHKQ